MTEPTTNERKPFRERDAVTQNLGKHHSEVFTVPYSLPRRMEIKDYRKAESGEVDARLCFAEIQEESSEVPLKHQTQISAIMWI